MNDPIQNYFFYNFWVFTKVIDYQENIRVKFFFVGEFQRERHIF